MLRISKQVDYGILLLAHCTGGDRSTIHSTRDLAAESGLPVPMVSKILKGLARDGILDSFRGTKGGYTLARDAAQITVAAIVRALEGPIVLASGDGNGDGDETSRVVTENAFSELSDSIEACFDAITIQDLCDRGDAHGVRRAPPRRYVYSI